VAAGPADQVLDTFKTLVWDNLVTVAVDAIEGSIHYATWGFFAWLSVPLNYVIGVLVRWLTDKVYLLLRDTVNLEVIMLTNEAHHAAYVKASQDLQSAWDKYGGGSSEFKTIREVHKAALAKFVRWSGT
jgi:hypothetical protein